MTLLDAETQIQTTGNVCQSCGCGLSALRIDGIKAESRYQLGCKFCNKFTQGVPEKHYELVEWLEIKGGLRDYSRLETYNIIKEILAKWEEINGR